MEKNKEILIMQENLFTTIAKLLALNIIKRNIGSAKQLAKGDAEVQTSLESLKFHTQRLEKLLKDLCDRDPTNFRCKEYRPQKHSSPNFK
jgi:hypothetical protein